MATSAASLTSESDVQPKKASISMREIPLGISIPLREAQFLKACCPMAPSSLRGMRIYSSEAQPENAKLPIVLNVSGKMIIFALAHLPASAEKALSAIAITFFPAISPGMTTASALPVQPVILTPPLKIWC